MLCKYSKHDDVDAALDSIIKFQHEHIWVIFQLIQGLTGFIGKMMYKQI